MVAIRNVFMAMLFALLVGSANAGAVSTLTLTPTTADGSVYNVLASNFSNISGIDFRVFYDAATLANPQVASGTFATGTTMVANTATPGSLRVVFMMTTGGSLNGEGPLAAITFTKVGMSAGRLIDFKAELISNDATKVAVQPVIGALPAATDLSGDSSNTTQSPSETPATATFKVTTSLVAGEGSITPPSVQNVNNGSIVSFTLLPLDIYEIGGANGCFGTLSGNIYTTGPIHSDCTVNVTFNQKTEPEQSSGVASNSSQTSDQEETPTPSPTGGGMANLIDEALTQKQLKTGTSMGDLTVLDDTYSGTGQQQTTIVQQQTTVTTPAQKKEESKKGQPRSDDKSLGDLPDSAPTATPNTAAPSTQIDSGKGVASPGANMALAKLAAMDSPVNRFSTFKGTRTLKNLEPLFDAASARAAGFVQIPAIAVSDGKNRLSIKLGLASTGFVPNFRLKGANLKSIRPLSDKVWELSVLPQKGKADVRLTVLVGSGRAEVPLVVVPPLDAVIDRDSNGLSEAGVNALLAKGGTGKPVYDLNGDGKQDFLDDYILVAHYLRHKQMQQKPVTPAKK
ncbi:MAG: hypothetical protein CXR30_05915 [Geobacter sp.]|nr:MAG: hypothetical protein CXR30_05915 [Geobacter sp.]